MSQRAARVIVVVGLLLFGGAAVVPVTRATSDAGTASAQPTKGPIPDSAWTESGEVDLAQVPDFVPALDQDGGRAGYIDKMDILGPDANPPPDHVVTGFQPEPPVPVVADDLETLVGHHYGGVGFVLLGEDPPSLEEQQAGVTISYEGSDTEPGEQ